MQGKARFIRDYVFYGSLALMAVCLAAAFILIGQWSGSACAAMVGLLWFLSRKRTNRWLPHMFLFLTMAFSAVAILSGADPLLGMAGSVFALMAWDVHQLISDIQGTTQEETTGRFEYRHLRSLILSLGAGLSVAIIARMIRLQLPFILLFVLVLLILFGLDRLWSQLARNK